MNQSGRGRSSGGGELVRLPVRWIVLFTGYKATEDYVPAASEGEDPALVKEATDICVAFHPHSEIRLFPKEAMLFWRAKSTQDWIVTRVSTAPNPDGIRTALEYSSVVLDEKAFRELRFNPFRSRELQLHEKVRAQYMARSSKPLWVDLPDESFPAAHTAESNGSRPSANYGAEPGELVPGLGSDRLSSIENVEKIETYCGYCAVLLKVPPTFATWWPSGEPPEGYFDVVLRSPQARAMSLRDATDVVATLAAEITAALPRTTGDDTVVSELARTALSHIETAQNALSEAGTRINSETVDQFREHLSTASNGVLQVSKNLSLIVKRMGDRISSTDAARLTRLSQQSEAIAPEFLGIRHPNPFAARVPSMLSATGTKVTKKTVKALGDSRPSYGLIAAVLAVLAVIAGAIVLVTRKSVPTDDGRTVRNNRNATNVKSTPVSVPHGNATLDPAFVKAVGAQDQVEEDAKGAAREQVKTAAASDGAKPVSERELEVITIASIRSAYHKTLDDNSYKSVFVSGRHVVTTYDDLKALLPSLVPAVHEAAALAATQDEEAVKIKDAATAAEARTRAEERGNNTTPTSTSPAGHESRNAATGESDSHKRDIARHAGEQPRSTPAPPEARHPTKNASAPAGTPPTKAASGGAPPSKTGTADQSGL